MTQTPGSFHSGFRPLTASSGTGPIPPRNSVPIPTVTEETAAVPDLGDRSAATRRPGHEMSPASLRFGNTEPTLDAQLEQLRQSDRRLQEALRSASPEQKPALEAERADVIQRYRTLSLSQAEQMPERSHNNLGIEDFMANLQQLSPGMASLVGQASEGASLTAESLALNEGQNFPLALMLSSQNPAELKSLDAVLKVVQSQGAAALSPQQLEQLKQFGLYVKDQQVINLVNQQPLDATAITQLQRVAAGASDAAGPLGQGGLAAFQALNQVTGTMAQALGDISALREARQTLDQLVANLNTARQDVQQRQQEVLTLEADLSNAELENQALAADIHLLDELDQLPEDEEPRLANPASQGRWETMMQREGFVRTESGGWYSSLHERSFSRPGPLRRFLRERLEHRRDVLSQRMAAMRGLLSQAMQGLSQALGQLRDCESAVGRQQTQVAHLSERADRSTRLMQDTLRDPGLRAQIPGGLLDQLDRQAADIGRAHAQESAAANRSMQAADTARAQAREQIQAGIALLDRLDPSGELTRPLKTHPQGATKSTGVNLNDQLDTALQALAAQPESEQAQTRALLEDLRNELDAIRQDYARTQAQASSREALDEQLEQQFSLRLRTALSHHQQQLEALDLRRSEQLDQLLATP